MHPPHVLVLVQNLPVPFDRRVWMEATTLQQAGYQVTVLCPNSEKHPKLRETIEGVRIRRFPLFFEGRGTFGMIAEYAWSLTCMWVMTALQALKQPIDVVHICNPPDALFLCALPARIFRKSKIIFDQHDLGPELWEAKGKNPRGIMARIIEGAERATYLAADVVISTNESYRQTAIRRGQKGIDNVFIVRSAPRRSFAVSAPLPARHITDSAKIVYLGTMGSQEGIDLLLEAFEMLSALMPETRVELDLVGDGPERQTLERMANMLGISERCHFHGRVNDDELRRIVSFADIAVNPDRPSKMNDLSSMNKIVEYMALAVPIIQFRCTEGERTALEAGHSVPEATSRALAEGIACLLCNVDARQAMKTAGWERFKAVLCWETQTESLLDAYRKASSLR